MYTARIEVTFDAAHRLLGYPGKCASAHGHTFRAEIVVAAPELDALGLTLDFRELKAHLREWVDAHWDHGFLASDRDTQLVEALRAVPGCKLYLFRGVNPSTEAIARELFEEAQRRFGAVVARVRVWETPAQYAEYVPDRNRGRRTGAAAVDDWVDGPASVIADGVAADAVAAGEG